MKVNLQQVSIPYLAAVLRYEVSLAVSFPTNMLCSAMEVVTFDTLAGMIFRRRRLRCPTLASILPFPGRDAALRPRERQAHCEVAPYGSMPTQSPLRAVTFSCMLCSSLSHTITLHLHGGRIVCCPTRFLLYDFLRSRSQQCQELEIPSREVPGRASVPE